MSIYPTSFVQFEQTLNTLYDDSRLDLSNFLHFYPDYFIFAHFFKEPNAMSGKEVSISMYYIIFLQTPSATVKKAS